MFIVWNPNGPYPPRQKHSTREAAQRAAESMARQHRGETFFVMQATDAYVVREVQHTDLTKADAEIPF